MTIYICGDSTAATYPPENAPITGWGQLLGDYLPNVNVVNKAVGGRSTKSFLAEGRLTDIERTIQPGDLLLIQFTHNDTSDLVWRHTDPNTSFSANLETYVIRRGCTAQSRCSSRRFRADTGGMASSWTRTGRIPMPSAAWRRSATSIFWT